MRTSNQRNHPGRSLPRSGRGPYDMGCELARVVERHRRRLGCGDHGSPTGGGRLNQDRTGRGPLYVPEVASEGGVALLARLLPLLRCGFHGRAFWFGSTAALRPRRCSTSGAQPRLDYVVAMASNAVLLRHAEPAMLVARALASAASRPASLHGHPLCGGHVERRAPGHHQGRSRPSRGPRAAGQPAFRGDVRQTPQREGLLRPWRRQNRIKELKDLQLDRTSCCRLRANHHVFLTAEPTCSCRNCGARGAHRVCPNPGDVAARSATQERPQLRPPPRRSAALDAESRRVAQDRPFPRGARRVTRVWTRVHSRHHGEAVFGQPASVIVPRIAARPRRSSCETGRDLLDSQSS